MYHNGLPNGFSESFFQNGQPSFKSNFYNGIQVGLFQSYYENGNLKLKGNFKNGKKDGLALMYYENGKLSSEMNYRDGKKEGLQINYGSDGRVLVRTYYVDDIKATDTKNLFTWDDITYEILVFNSNGKPRKERDQKPFSGLAVQYHNSRDLQRKGSYLNGLPHGIWEFYTKRGKLEFKDSYENGELIFSQTYYVGGQLKAKENYKNKQKHGISETFSKTGELEGRTNFKNGNVDGLVELFNVDGQEYQSFCYRNNEAAQMSYCEI
jgi:antitoxin component YwqK of YwqJK toxin-antitoxin module